MFAQVSVSRWLHTRLRVIDEWIISLPEGFPSPKVPGYEKCFEELIDQYVKDAKPDTWRSLPRDEVRRVLLEVVDKNQYRQLFVRTLRQHKKERKKHRYDKE